MGIFHQVSYCWNRTTYAFRYSVGAIVNRNTLWVLAIFLRFGHTRMRIMDSLCQNAYGIYLVHYLFVIWLQYFLLPAPFRRIRQGGIAFVGTVALS